MFRFGAPVFGFNSPETWIKKLRKYNFTAAYWPLGDNADEAAERSFAEAAAEADIVIAETGGWSNPLSPDSDEAKRAFDLNVRRLKLADRIGARCCVNITGSISSRWDGPSPENFTQKTFDLIVKTVRAIIDTAEPEHTYYALEMMPWAYPHTAEAYAELAAAIDRPRFAAHLDPVNILTSPYDYYNSGKFLNNMFDVLGDTIKSCHAKDVLLIPTMPVHIDEVAAGKGVLDYVTYTRRVSELPGEVPLMLEHLSNEAQYTEAAVYVQKILAESGIK